MSIIDNAKEVANAVHEIKNLELYGRVLNLNAGIMDLVEENRQLKAKVEGLEKAVALRAKMKFEEPFYFQEGDKTPFCPACFEGKETAAVHVVFRYTSPDNTQTWECPVCENEYKPNKSRSAPQPNTGPNFRTSQWG